MKTFDYSDLPIAIGMGNVSATISDRKITIAVSAGNAVASYSPEILSQQVKQEDFYAFQDWFNTAIIAINALTSVAV